MSETIRELGEGLVLRTADPRDADELGEFNVRLHSDDLDEPDEGLRSWTRDLLSGRHPTVGPDDITVVEDADGKIVSSGVLISQRWRYEDVEFGVGRPELIATDPAYRRLGLVREQMDVLHARSAAKGEMVTAITGIPWYYRQFGYEMGLELGGGRRFFWGRPGNLADVKEERYRLREAGPEDIPDLLDLLDGLAEGSMVSSVRDETHLRWEVDGETKGAPGSRYYHVIEDEDGVAGFADIVKWPPSFGVRQLAVRPDRPLRAVALFLTRELHRLAERLNPAAKKKFTYVFFGLARSHPVYDALDKQLEGVVPGYAWYVRVPDLEGFLLHLKPVLERRLAASAMVGHTGELRLNFYRKHTKLVLERGRLVGVEDWEPKRIQDGDVHFPDLTFLSVLFGRASIGELRRARVDCYARNEEAEILLHILFPTRSSHVLPIN